MRDFSLQLIDEYGDEITSNQYLENALEHRDGFGNDVDFKNKIRHLIKCFFQQRSCFALVRPLTSEEGLVKLSDCKLENLRAEFVEEALKLRNSILLNAKVKTMEGKQVSGEIIGGILKAYIDTINSGVIPNIENTWTYVTQSHSTRLLDKCIQEYRTLVTNKLRKMIPADNRLLKDHLSQFRAEVMRNFREQSFLKSEENIQYETTLIEKMREEKHNLFAENDSEFENLLSNAMNSNYKENIFNIVVSEQLKETKEIVSALKSFKSTFEAIEPDGPKKLERVYKFLFSKSCEAFSIFFNNTQTKMADKLADKNREYKINQEKLEDEIKKLGEIKLKNEMVFRSTETQMGEIQFENEKMKESLKFLKEEMFQTENDLNNKREEEKSVYKKKQEELIRKIDDNQRVYKDLESKFVKQKSDFQIELALLNQKIEFYVNIEKDLNDQKGKLILKQKQLEEDYNARLAKVVQDFEKRLKEKSAEVQGLRDNKYAIEDELKSRQNYNESVCSEFVDKEDELKSIITTHEKTIFSLKNQVQNCENLNVAQTFQEKQLIEKVQKLENQIKTHEEKLREKDEKITSAITSLDTTLAVERQKTAFLEIKLSELTSENEELKKRKDSNLQMLELKNLPKIDLNGQLHEVRLNYEERVRKMLVDFDIEKEELSKQYTKQIEENEEKIKELKSEKDVLFSTKLTLSQFAETSKQKIKTLEEKVTFLEGNQNKVLQDKFSFFEEQIKKLNFEKDQLVLQKEEESDRNKRVFDENLMNMQIVFDSEKNRLDKKLSEEKLKFEVVLNETIEEFERKKAEELAQLEEENQYLTVEYQGLELKHKSINQKFEGEVSSLKAKLEFAEKKAQDLANSLDKELTGEKNKLKYLTASLEQEKLLLNEKLNTLKNEITAKNLELFQAKQQSDSQIAAAIKNTNEKSKEIENMSEEINDLRLKMENVTTDKYSISEELINVKISLNKEIALKTQKIEFLESKISDLNNNNEYFQKEMEEKLRFVKIESDQEKESLNKSKREEITIWESRYEEKKKSLKELENTFSVKLNELEKSKYILQEKLSSAELKREEFEKKSQIDCLKFENDFKKLKESYLSERKEIISEIEMLRKEKYELEIGLAETHARLDKDKAVFESKIAFLEQQNRKLKSDLTDSQNSFDSMFQKFHQFRVSDKEETENSHTSYVISLEQRYNAQIQDLKEQQKTMVDSLKDKIKAYEKEIKRLEQINYEHLNNKHGSGVYQEKKISEMLENEKQLQDELVRIKSIAEKTSVQLQKEFDKEREVFKKRLLDQELKMKRLETEKNLMIFEQEKQKTKWNIEKDHLISSKTEFLENLDRLKKQKEQLIRENEKLKTDLRMVKKATIGNSLFTFAKNKSDVLSVEKSNRSSHEQLGTGFKAKNTLPGDSDDE